MLYTRKGDEGETYCFAMGRRVRKDHPLMELLGTLDEANSFIGLARSFCRDETVDRELKWIQLLLFRVGFTVGGKDSISEDDVKRLEEMTDRYFKDVSLHSFVLPSGDTFVSALHVSRSIVRRAERVAVTVVKEEGIKHSPLILKILNRLSDVLFAMAVYHSKHLEEVK